MCGDFPAWLQYKRLVAAAVATPKGFECKYVIECKVFRDLKIKNIPKFQNMVCQKRGGGLRISGA